MLHYSSEAGKLILELFHIQELNISFDNEKEMNLFLTGFLFPIYGKRNVHREHKLVIGSIVDIYLSQIDIGIELKYCRPWGINAKDHLEDQINRYSKYVKLLFVIYYDKWNKITDEFIEKYPKVKFFNLYGGY